MVHRLGPKDRQVRAVAEEDMFGAEVAMLGKEEEETSGFQEEEEAGILVEDLARDQEDDRQEQILWLAMCVGCVAIWPVTVPKMLELLEEAEPPTLHMCNEAQVATEVEEGALDSLD